MRAIPIILALSLSLMAGQGRAAAADAEGRYQALLARAKANAPNVDWAQLRLAYAERPRFKAFAQSAARRQMLEAAGASNCKDALPAARAAIAEDFVDADAHFIAAFCEDAAGDAAGAKLDRDIGVGLIKSIQTGDGLSPATAFTVIDVDEEYAVMRALGLKVRDQALLQQAGHAYDRLQTTDEKGQTAAYYFLVDRVLAAEAAAMTPGAISEGGPPGRTP
ncbi:MAG TPA: DUF4919 domain-containing protein [Caulobacteraceae bacterium]|jgi:hypothetical protein